MNQFIGTQVYYYDFEELPRDYLERSLSMLATSDVPYVNNGTTLLV
jgi:hypothetical protein